MKLLGNIQDNKDIINKEYVKDMVISSDDSIDDVLTVTSAEFDEMLQAGTLDPNTLYNVTDGNEQDKVVYNTVPVGTGVLWFGDLESVPDNFIVPDGSIVNISDYPDLFAIWGTKYGGNGTTTFGLPNLKGKVVVMRDENDTDFDTVGETGGEKTHTLTSAEMPSHTHTQKSITNPGDHAHNTWNVFSFKHSSGGITTTCTGEPGDGRGNATQGAGGHTHTVTLNNTGGDGAHNNLQPYVVAYYIIKAKRGVYTESLRRLDSEVAQMKKNLHTIDTELIMESGAYIAELRLDFPTGFTRNNCVIISVMSSNVVEPNVDYNTTDVAWDPAYNYSDVSGTTAIPRVVASLSNVMYKTQEKVFISWEVGTPYDHNVKRFVRVTLFKFM